MFYWLLFYRYFSYIIVLLLVEGMIVVLFLFLVYLGDLFVMRLELIFLFLCMMVFEGVIGLCLLVNSYRLLGLGYYNCL